MAVKHTASYLRERFEQAGIRPVTKHGQNFLIDMNLQRLLVETGDVGRDDVVLEIGTGTGAVTAEVAKNAAAVVTVEIDFRMHQLAKEELVEFDNIDMLQLDALKNKNRFNDEVLEAVRRRLDEGENRRLKLVANLPYNIATPIVSNLLLTDITPVLMAVTIQKELADRITASPGSKDYGALSIWMQTLCDVETVRIMPPTVFWPRPKVHSAIVRIAPREELRSRVPDLRFYHEFVRSLFFHRRKYLRANLLGAFKGRLDKPAIDAILAEAGLEGETRSEQLTVEEILRLSEIARRSAESE